MPEYDAGFDDFDNDDDLGNEEAIQALSNAEKNHDVKPHINVLYYIDSILIQYRVIHQGTLYTISILYCFNILIQYTRLTLFCRTPSCSK